MMKRVGAILTLLLAVGLAAGLGLFAGFSYGYAHQHFKELAPADVVHWLARLRERGEADEPPSLPPGVWHRHCYAEEPCRSGVIVHDAARTFEGLNLYLSAHAPEAVLMDMAGAVLHRWSCEFDAVEETPADPAWHWQRAHLFANGDLLALHDGAGLVKLDRASNVLWTYRGPCRHDFCLAPDGRIYVLAAESKVLPWVHETNPVVEDFVVVLDANGAELRKVSLLECFERSVYASVLERIGRWGELLFANAIEPLHGGGFGGGDVLVSAWMLDTTVAIDLDAGEVVWALSGLWSKQRDVAVLKDNHLLVAETRPQEGLYRLLEIDPRTQRVAWTRDLATPGIALGHESVQCQRVPNGNTLLVESDNGRALELTPGGHAVWEFRNPHRAGPGDAWVARLAQLTRLPADFPCGWADAAEAR